MTRSDREDRNERIREKRRSHARSREDPPMICLLLGSPSMRTRPCDAATKNPGSATNPDPRLIIVGSRSSIRTRERDPLFLSRLSTGQNHRCASQEFNVKFQLRHSDTTYRKSLADPSVRLFFTFPSYFLNLWYLLLYLLHVLKII